MADLLSILGNLQSLTNPDAIPGNAHFGLIGEKRFWI
jgi:hypothetical protein